VASMQRGLKLHRVALERPDSLSLTLRFAGPSGTESANFGFVREGTSWRCYLFSLPGRM
jgi:hypothetical protein